MDSERAFWDALKIRDIDQLRRLLKSGISANLEHFKSGRSALLCAIGNEATVRLLLEFGANPNPPNCKTPFMYAVGTGNLEVVRLLLDCGADINSRNPEGGETALMYAADCGAEQVLRLLIGSGANLEDAADIPDLLHSKCKLSDAGIDCPAHPIGMKALHVAAVAGNLKCASALLDAGADLRSECGDGVNALLLAAALHHQHIVQYLIGKGATTRLKEGYSWTIIRNASDDPDICKIICEASLHSPLRKRDL